MRLGSAFILMFVLCGNGWAAPSCGMSLADALGRVMARGHDMRLADKAIDSAKAQADMAAAALATQVNAVAGQTYYAYQPAAMTGGQKINTSEKSFISAGIDVYRTLFDFGATRIRHQASQTLAERALDEAGRVRNQAALAVITAYIDVLEAQRMRTVAVHELAAIAGHRREVAILYREGVATRHDLLTVRVRFNAARQKVVVARSQEKVALARLKEILSWHDEGCLCVKEAQAMDAGAVSLTQAWTVAMRLRLELAGLDKAVTAADLDEAAVLASDKPSFFASGGYSYADNRYQARDDNWRAGLGVKFSVFNGGLTRASAARARALKDGFMEERRKMEDAIRFEVEKAYWEMDNARQRKMLHATALAQARENARVAWVQYHEGVGTSMEFLDALVWRTGAEADLWQGTYAHQRAQARFLYAMGRDLVSAYGQEVGYEER